MNDEFDAMEEEENGATTSVEMYLPISVVTQKYVILSLAKLHGWFRFGGEDRHQVGASFEIPAGRVLDVAFVRPGKETEEEELPDNVLLFDDLIAIRKQMILAEMSLRHLTDEKGDF